MADATEEVDVEESPSPIKDEKKFYGDALDYWSNITPNMSGMLGGYERISPTDINGSKAFLRPFLKVFP